VQQKLAPAAAEENVIIPEDPEKKSFDK